MDRTESASPQSQVIFCCAFLLLCAGCKTESQDGKEIPRIHAREVWFKSKPLPKLDNLFQDAKPGETLEFEIIMPSVDVRRSVGTELLVKRGSVTFFSDQGYSRFLPLHKVACSPSKDKSEKVGSFTPRANIYIDFVRGTDPQGVEGCGAYLHVNGVDFEKMGHEDPEEYYSQTISHKENNGKVTIRVKVKFSSDFEGSLRGWSVVKLW